MGDVNFSQWLRPVGQLLEPLGIESFALQVENDGVSIRAEKLAARPMPPPQEVSLRAIWQSLRGKKTEPTQEPQRRWEILQLRYTRDDIARMDSEAKSRRDAAGNRP
ncbi:MAG: hypothetical protein FJ143_10715, partial [Deltaproteobacteria bacterium]|nr:hypothetical protein [Deltaproteobacteria bacterium]